MRTCRLVITALALAAPAATLPAQAGPVTRVSGAVFDSVAMRPLGGALVQLAAGARVLSVTADSLGRFLIDSAPSGEHLLGFLHPRLDSLVLNPPLYRASLHGGEMRAELAIPSAATLVRQSCGAQAADDSLGLMVGHVLGADDHLPRPKATVVTAWLELELRESGMFRAVRTSIAQTNENGVFALCGVPEGAMLGVRVAIAADTSPMLELPMPTSGYLARDMFVGAVLRASAEGDVAVKGGGRVRGRVVGSPGQPLAGARVRSVWSGAEAITDRDGSFTLDSLPTGSQMLEARAIGFLRDSRLVDVLEHEVAGANFELAAAPTELDTVRVVTTPVYRDAQRREFDERRKQGLGQFFADDEITKRNPVWFTDMMRLVPGAQVVPTTRGGRTIVMRGGPGMGTGYCRPDIWIDGARSELGGMSFDNLLPINMIRAIEVYSRAEMVPSRFTSLSGCGAILVWTGERPPLDHERH